MATSWLPLRRNKDQGTSAMVHLSPSLTALDARARNRALMNGVRASPSLGGPTFEGDIQIGEESLDELYATSASPRALQWLQNQRTTQAGKGPTAPNPNPMFPLTMDSFKRVIGVDEVHDKKSNIKAAMFAEFLGTFLLVFIGCAAALDRPQSVVQVALAFGLIVATMIMVLGPVSDCHINPAVSFGLLLNGQCSFLRAIYYIPAQCIGAICGAALLKVLVPSEQPGHLGATTLQELNGAQGLILEALITFVLVLIICTLAAAEWSPRANGALAPIAIGLTVTACHLMALRYTGASMNPARSFGPALFARRWKHHWVYWLGPFIGGGVAGILHRHCFQPNANPKLLAPVGPPLPQAVTVSAIEVQALPLQ